ncbi:MAG: hypothetical protein IPH00_01575 [Flavobacteriales bacterium]|nr:hypothetical protein [Flavobacteriales bacterium]
MQAKAYPLQLDAIRRRRQIARKGRDRTVIRPLLDAVVACIAHEIALTLSIVLHALWSAVLGICGAGNEQQRGVEDLHQAFSVAQSTGTVLLCKVDINSFSSF